MRVVRSFLVTLFSNVAHDTYTNTTSHFRTTLSTPTDFKGYWEVGLVDIDYPKSWYNTPKHPEQERTWSIARQVFTLVNPDVDFNVGIDSLDEVQSIATSVGETKISVRGRVGVINFGNYKIRDLVDAINIKLRRFDETHKSYFKRHTGFFLDEQNLICTLFVGIGDTIVLPHNIASVLRLNIAEGVEVNTYGDSSLYVFRGPVLESDPELYNEVIYLHNAGPVSMLSDQYRYGNAYIGEGVPNFPLDTTNLFIYSNIVDYELVGNIQTRLLRTVRAEGNFGEYSKRTFDRPLFKKMAYDRLEEIEIFIRSDDGNYMKFEFGNVSMSLLFRKLED